MEDFYPFTVQDLPKLSPLLEKDLQRFSHGNDVNTSLFLAPLALDLFEDLKKVREFKEGLKNKDVKEGFLEMVKLWLEENNGTGNLLKLVKVLRLNGYLDIAHALELIIINCYSLPSDDDFCYSSSRNFLTEEEQPPACVISREKTFQNCVVMKEIFKKLDPAGQKTFRLVSSAWHEETFKFWRKHARIKLNTVIGQGDDMVEPEGISMILFSIYVRSIIANSEIGDDTEALLRNEQELEDQFLQKLISDPFNSYKMSFAGEVPFSRCNSVAMIKPFLEILGPHIEDLQIDQACFNDGPGDFAFGVLRPEELLKKFCGQLLHNAKNLKKLEILLSCAGHFKTYYSRHNAPEEQAVIVNVNLHTLKFGIGLPPNTLRHILHMCPNLKELSLTTEEGLDGLPHRTATGDFFYLEKLSVNLSTEADILQLSNYVKGLDRVSLRRLQLKGVNLADARLPPFHLYGAIGHCSQNLRSLELQVCIPGELARKWYTDLAPFSFPVLSQLKLSFDSVEEGQAGQMKFDFGTLKGMPRLKLLEISSKQDRKEEVRNPGVQDWIFEGDRNNYFPERLTTDYFYSDEDPILCSELKEFSFLAWSLTKEDIGLFQSWFPKLTCLETKVKPDALPVLLEKWDLDKLKIHTEELVSLRELRPLKENKFIRIFQTVRGVELSCTVELKEHNKNLYFLSV